MTKTTETPPDYLHPTEVARHLRLERGSVYNLVTAGLLKAVYVGTTGRGMRITRTSWEAYKARIEAEAEARHSA